MVQIIRHGQSLHNVDRGYPHRDPPLTDAGLEAAKQIKIPAVPDLVVISPMTRTIQTAINAFPSILSSSPPRVQIWPTLREAHDAECNKGISRAEIEKKFPFLDFAECPEEWDHPPHTTEGATKRAEGVRQRLKELSATHNNIALFTHRGFIAFLVRGDRYDVCETRSYRFAEETEKERLRFGVNVDLDEPQDFGPTVLVQQQQVHRETEDVIGGTAGTR